MKDPRTYGHGCFTRLAKHGVLFSNIFFHETFLVQSYLKSPSPKHLSVGALLDDSQLTADRHVLALSTLGKA